MTEHSDVLVRYRRLREVGLRLNNRLIGEIPKRTLQECGRTLGFLRKGILVFDSQEELSILMDYCLYHPLPGGGNLVAESLKENPPPPDSEEMAVLQAMTRSYYSLFQVTEVERGVGVSVVDVLRTEPGFIADVGFGNSAQRYLMLASRVLPIDGFLMSGGAALPVDASAARQILDELTRAKLTPDAVDFRQITPRREAEVAALMIRTCRSTGMSTRVRFEDAGRSSRQAAGALGGRDRRNVRCPCGSGKKYRACCGRR
jgi:SEC-C motif